MNDTGLDSLRDSEGEEMVQITVEDLFHAIQSKLQLELMAGKEGLNNVLRKPRIQKSSLALAGHTDHIDPSKIQILGETEITYLSTLSPEKREKRLERFTESQVPCFIVTKGQDVPEELIRISNLQKIPLLRSPKYSSRCIKRITSYLEEVLAHRVTRSGVLVDVYGVGILILGKSGIGKSECALDLIDRGHRLVTDDAVVIKKKDPDILIGSSPDLTRRHMEIRGLGIINIKDLYGVSSIQEEKEINLVVELIEWSPSENIDRLGLDEKTYGILNVPKPYLRMPVRPGRNMALILEVAAKNHLLKTTGVASARRFEKKLLDEINEQSEH
jgi:HPr kinase/phosphorylase